MATDTGEPSGRPVVQGKSDPAPRYYVSMTSLFDAANPNERDPPPKVTENLQGTSTVTGTIGVTERRRYTIAGYINTAHSRINTAVSQEQNFSSNQIIDFDTVNGTVLDQKTIVHNSVNSLSTTSTGNSSLVTATSYSFPITVDFVSPVSSSRFGFTVKTTQDYKASKLVLCNGKIEDFGLTMNSVRASDVSPASSSQHYTSFDLRNRLYDCEISSAKNVLTKVSPGCGP